MDTLTNQPLGTVVIGLSASPASRDGVLMATGTITRSLSFGWEPRAADDHTPFEREKAAFLRKRPLLRQHAGEYVAIHDGEVAASDRSRNGALRKFFARYPANTSVYIGFVGTKPMARVGPHFFVQRPQ